MKRSERGFTIVEVLVAMIMLSIGVLALASTSGSITRLMYGAKSKTVAASYATSVLDSVRYRAVATTPRCTAVTAASGSSTPRPGTTVAWRVTTATDQRDVRVVVTWQNGRGTSTDTTSTSIYCG